MMSGSVTIADNAQVAFQGNHSRLNGGAITSRQHVTIEGPGSVQFISYSPSQGGAIASAGDCVIFSSQNVTSVQFISNSPRVGGKETDGGGGGGKGEKEKKGKRGKQKALMLIMTNPDINPSIYKYLYCYFAISGSIVRTMENQNTMMQH